jgi:putative copper resistance protein D
MGRRDSATVPAPVQPRHVVRALLLVAIVTGVLAAASQISNFGLKPIPRVPRFSLGVDWLLISAVVATAYFLMLFRGRRRIRQPLRRAAAFLGGLGALLGAFVSPLDAYVNHSFFAHMTQHVLLLFVVAPLLVLGAPVTVFLEGLSDRWRGRARSWLQASPELAVLSHPVVPALIFVTVQFSVQLTPFFNRSLNTGAGHSFGHGLYLMAGFLFWWPVIGVDPMPRPISLRARSIAMALALVSTAILAGVLLRADAPLFPHYASLPIPWGGQGALVSQQKAGTLLLGVSLAVGIGAAILARRGGIRHRRTG